MGEVTGKVIVKGCGFFMCPNDLFDKKHDIYDVRKREIRRMNANEMIVLSYLVRCANNDNKAFPSYNKIAECCSISRMTAFRCIDNLSASKYIEKRSRGYNTNHETGIKRYSNVYEIDVNKLK